MKNEKLVELQKLESILINGGWRPRIDTVGTTIVRIVNALADRWKNRNSEE